MVDYTEHIKATTVEPVLVMVNYTEHITVELVVMMVDYTEHTKHYSGTVDTLRPANIVPERGVSTLGDSNSSLDAWLN